MPTVNNAFYSDLGERWFTADDHAVALLRAETALKLAYTREALARAGIGPGARVLDVACGAGFTALPLAEAGYRVRGMDLAEGAIRAARRRAAGLDAEFYVGDAYALDEPDGAFDAVLLLDMLEHVERPGDVLREAARVLRPGGIAVFHTFNRTPLAWALAIHGFKFVVREAPEHIHVYRLFIPPRDLERMAGAAGLSVREVRGVRPVVDGAFWRSVARRRLDKGFRFTYAPSRAVAYIGHAAKG